MIKSRIYILAVLVCFFTSGFSQSDENALETLLGKYKNRYLKKEYVLTYDQIYYSDWNKENKVRSQKVVIEKSGDVYYKYSTNDMLIVNNKEYKIIVDSLDKIVYIHYPDTSNSASAYDLNRTENKMSVKRKPNGAESDAFEISAENENVSFSKMNITFSKKSEDLTSVEIYYNEDYFFDALVPDKLLLEFRFYPVLSDRRIISWSDKIAVKTATGFELSKGYQDFELYDLRISKK